MNLIKPLLGSQIIASHPLAQGLVRCYLANEGSGNMLADIARGANGTFQGSAGWEVGQMGHAISLEDTTSDYVDCGELLIVGAYSIVCCFKEVSDSLGRPVSFYHSSGYRGMIEYSLGQSYIYTAYDNDHYQGWEDKIDNDDAYHTYVYTWDGDSYSLYKDGVDQGPATKTGNPSDDSADKLFIGAASRSTPERFFDGPVAYVYIYDRELTPFEIRSLYSHPYQFIRRPSRLAVWAAATAGAAADVDSFAALSRLKTRFQHMIVR